MSDIQLIAIVALLVVGGVCGVAYGIVRQQQHTIDRLTDKLMAKDYQEYTAYQPREKPPDEQPRREALSWYDDPYTEDVKHG